MNQLIQFPLYYLVVQSHLEYLVPHQKVQYPLYYLVVQYPLLLQYPLYYGQPLENDGVSVVLFAKLCVISATTT